MEKNAAFTGIMTKYKALIYKIARSYASDEEALQDLFQEISLQLWRSIGNYDSSRSSSTWVYKVALNTSISYLRVNSKHTRNIDPSVDLSMIINEEKNDEKSVIYTLLNRLGKIERAIMILHLEGLSYLEIAQTMDVSETNIGTKISRIKKRWAEQLRGEK